MLDLALSVCCCCYYKATGALARGMEADARLLVLKIEGDKIRSKCSNATGNGSWQRVSASEQDTIELCKDVCRPATKHNVDSNEGLKKDCV